MVRAWIVATLLLNATHAMAAQHTFQIGEKDFLLDGKPLVIRCGEIHFARVPREYWQHRLRTAKAMGLNAVCVYLFWNLHEWAEGKYDWTGQADAAEFCRLAQQEGLWVILRPGPYSCAEWEMGGLPWWLLKNDRIKLRSSDPAFLDPATRYLTEVGRVLGKLQITRGGPILMAQVENEYGSFGKDANYMGALRQALIDGGFDIPLFACNPPGAIAHGWRPDLFQVVNFGAGGGRKAFEKLRSFQKEGPLMNGEYYPAWFDTWGRKHRTGAVEPILRDLEEMLKNNQSFSIYMAHGGTSFGFWAGADRPFLPDTTSYDYDAPISEAGWVTPKFEAIRALMSKYLEPGEKLPQPSPPTPVISIGEFTLQENVSLIPPYTAAVASGPARTMEQYDQSRGCGIYRTTLPPGPAGKLEARAVHDFAWVFLDGKLEGVMDRRSRRFRITLPERTKPVRLDILVEAMGRVNFGVEVFDRKGLHQPISFTAANGESRELTEWEYFPSPLDANQLTTLRFSQKLTEGPAFWRGHFSVTQQGDTFLDLRNWSKGVVWVNGHCLGRFWNIGPQQTLYCPGPWLKAGRNEIIVLDVIGPRAPKIAGLEKPILDELRPDLDFSLSARAAGQIEVSGLTPAGHGTFTADIQWQEATFSRPVKGRYLCFEALNSHDTQGVAAGAELDALDTEGKSLSKAKWKILQATSEETSAEAGYAENILDGQPASIWHSQYSTNKASYPHRLVIDLGDSGWISGLKFLQRGGSAGVPGRIKDWRVFVSEGTFGLVPK